VPGADADRSGSDRRAGAHGIMTLNDFKSMEGDTALGLKSLPVQLGADRAAWFACLVMALAQVAVIVCLLAWGLAPFALLIGLSLALQFAAMRRMLSDPERFAPWYNATGVSLYVLGMLATAFALRGVA